ncbi:MAG: hypothetical protein WAU75_04995, partial [Solirubrobacteraceae bacterium]
HATWPDLVRNVSIAILGNLIGGVGLVFATRLAQVKGDPASPTGGQRGRQEGSAPNRGTGSA